MAVEYEVEGTTYSFPDGTTKEDAIERVKQLKLEPGDLQIFKGRFTLHRVTKVEGQKSRYMCIPAYVLDPWRVNTPEHSKAIYGKVLPIHIERNIARSDGLAD